MKTINSLKIQAILIGIALCLFSCKKDEEVIPDNGSASYTDSRDGQTYETVQIGNETWFAENLNYDAGEGSSVYNDDPANAAVYGRLYDWETACEVCPDGWHLASDAEWMAVFDTYGGVELAGPALRETGTIHWTIDVGSTNESGMTILPGGMRGSDGLSDSMGEQALFWTSTESTEYPDNVVYWIIYASPGVYQSAFFKNIQLSIRCVKN